MLLPPLAVGSPETPNLIGPRPLSSPQGADPQPSSSSKAYYMGFVVVMVLVALMSIYHKQIIAWLKPIAAKLRELPGG